MENVEKMDAGLIRKWCWSGSGCEEKNVAEMKAGVMKRMLLKLKRE